MEEAEPRAYIWPDNMPAVIAFLRVSTQWRVASMGGFIGLDYVPLFRVLDQMCRDAEAWQAVFDDVRVMEETALELLNRKK